MQTYRVKLHDNGPALWPEHKPVEQVLELQATTPEDTWETTYQGNPTPPAGSVFRRAWWIGKNRYDPADRGLINSCLARWVSWDTGLKDKEVYMVWMDRGLAVHNTIMRFSTRNISPMAIMREIFLSSRPAASLKRV